MSLATRSSRSDDCIRCVLDSVGCQYWRPGGPKRRGANWPGGWAISPPLGQHLAIIQIMTIQPIAIQPVTFTPDQIALIEQIAQRVYDNRSSVAKLPSKPTAEAKAKDYHTIPQIRALVLQHLAEFSEYVGQEPFDIAIPRHWFSLKTQMMPGDLIVTNGKHQSVTRWEQQFLSAISSNTWPESPFLSVGQRRMYCLFTPTQLSF